MISGEFARQITHFAIQPSKLSVRGIMNSLRRQKYNLIYCVSSSQQVMVDLLAQGVALSRRG
jgi:hypothetical protein